MSSQPSGRLRPAEPSPAHDQSQSSLFTKLPLDVRRHIYLQLWLDCGLIQHIHAFSHSTYIQSYPCIFDSEECDKYPKPPTAEETIEAQAQAQDTQPADEQPQPLDDPGDINGAIQDITSAPAGPKGPDEFDKPWCDHGPCLYRWMEKWDGSFPRGYAAKYRGRGPSRRSRLLNPPDLRSSPLLSPLVVCKRMYQEAGESLFSSLRFCFPALDILDRFLHDVPQALSERIQFVDVMTIASGMPYKTLPPPTVTKMVHRILMNAFPKLTELRMTIHPTQKLMPLPNAEAFSPLYALAQESKNLRRFDVRLPFRCEENASLRYGGTPDFLRDAPFTAVLVPEGWHETADCACFTEP